MSEAVHASSTRGLQASPLIEHHSSHVNPTTEQRSKCHGDMENAKNISSILPDYISPLAGMVNYNNISRDFKYTFITTYIPKGIRVVGSQLGHIPLLKNNEFNLGDRNNYVMLSPHRYLTNTTGKKPLLISHPWIRDLTQSTILNVMKILHFGQHHEVNACVKLLLSRYHGGYL
jgi:hypothetical protein